MQNTDLVDKIVEDAYRGILERCNINYKEDENNEPECDYEQTGIGSGVRFERLRRITGYLVGDTSRWNNGKFAELQDRVKHG